MDSIKKPISKSPAPSNYSADEIASILSGEKNQQQVDEEREIKKINDINFDFKPRKMKRGGAVYSSASKRADGCVQRGKTKGTMV